MEPMTAVTAGLKAAGETISTFGKFWLLFQKLRYPKPNRNSTGIVIAIKTENLANNLQVKNDFTSTIRRLVESDESTKSLQILELPSYHLESLTSDREASRLLRRCRSKLIIWGIARERVVDKKNVLVLDFNVMATHDEVVKNVQDIFAAEMGELIPKRHLISKENNLLEMEMTAEGVALAARYLTGVAAYLSHNEPFAEEVFKQLSKTLSSLRKGLFGGRAALLEAKTNLCIAVIEIRASEADVISWRKTRNPKYLESMKSHLDVADALVQDSYSSVNKRALYLIEIEENVRGALKIFEPWKAMGVDDGTWAANIAYLQLYAGNLTAASRFYKVAFRRGLDSPIVLESLEYMEWKLSKNPDKYQLYYGLGMMEFHGRKEIGSASDYFRRFLDATPEGEYVAQVQEVNDLLHGKKEDASFDHSVTRTQKPRRKRHK